MPTSNEHEFSWSTIAQFYDPNQTTPNLQPQTETVSVEPQQREETFTCRECLVVLPTEEEHPELRRICNSCAAAHYCRCDDCDELYHENDLSGVENGERHVCQNCRENYFTCENCENVFHEEDAIEIIINGNTREVCRECYHERMDFITCGNCGNEYLGHCSCVRQNLGYRPGNGKNICDKREGDIIKSTRKFGVEIETIIENGGKSKKLPRSCAITRDGSLNSGGIEIVTPILQGKFGETYIKKITKDLAEATQPDLSCGLHVHIDAKGIDAKKAQQILAFYVQYENIFMKMVPEERRRSEYAKRLSTSYGWENTKNSTELEEYWYNTTDKERIRERKGSHYDSSRYHYINFHSLLTRGNIEVRLLEGTLDAEDILKWTALHVEIIEYIIENGIPKKIWDKQRTYTEKTVEKQIKELETLQVLSNDAVAFINKRINKYN